jgi:hypothetical protein
LGLSITASTSTCAKKTPLQGDVCRGKASDQTPFGDEERMSSNSVTGVTSCAQKPLFDVVISQQIIPEKTQVFLCYDLRERTQNLRQATTLLLDHWVLDYWFVGYASRWPGVNTAVSW